MYQLKGFVRIAALISNVVGVNSPLGEPSTWSLTYTKEKGEYSNALYPGYSLVSLSSVDTVLGRVPANPDYVEHVLEVSSFATSYAITKGGSIDPIEFRDDLLAEFQGKMNNLNYGEFVNNGSMSLPGWLSWINPSLPDNVLKVWFSDQAFSQEFDEFEITVIPPIENLDDFFLGPNSVRALVEQKGFSEIIDLAQNAKGNNPETAIRINTYDYNSIAYPDFIFKTYWGVLVYGLAGDNVDAIKDATIAYVLANSTHTREEWTSILPDLFKRTEFVIVPRWSTYAIPNFTTQAGIYSPVVNMKEAVAFTKLHVLEYPPVHIDNYLTVFGSPYRSLALLCISNPDNRLAKLSITDVYPDYINVGTLSLDFNRMSLATQGWAEMIQRLLIAAETMTAFSSIPLSMRRVKRGDKFYVAQVYQNIQYLVSAKLNYV